MVGSKAGKSLEVVKDMFDALSQRIRSPFAGSIVLAFLLWNWKPLWVLLFDSAPVAEKIAYFEAHTDIWQLYIFPCVSGIALALALPWVRYAGAYLATRPNRVLKELQAGEARDRRIAALKAAKEEEQAKSDLRVAQIQMTLAEEKARIELDTAKEQAAIEAQATQEQAALAAAKRLEEARGISDEAEAELKEQRELSMAEDLKEIPVPPEAIEVTAQEVMEWPFAIDMLRVAAKSKNGRVQLEGYSLTSSDSYGGTIETKLGDHHKDALVMRETFEGLSDAGLLEQIKKNYGEITKDGYAMLEEIEALSASA